MLRHLPCFDIYLSSTFDTIVFICNNTEVESFWSSQLKSPFTHSSRISTISMSTSVSFDYYLVVAFSDQPFGGNPAIVAFLDPNETQEDVLIKLAVTFNQPMTVFLSKEMSTQDTTSERFSVRYFTPSGTESMLCIHATLAAAKVIFQTERVGKEVKSLQFVTRNHGVVTAGRVTSENRDWIELDLVKGDTVEVLEPEKKKITEIMNGAFGKSFTVNSVVKGVGKYGYCLLVEVDEKDDIKNLSPVNITKWASLSRSPASTSC